MRATIRIYTPLTRVFEEFSPLWVGKFESLVFSRDGATAVLELTGDVSLNELVNLTGALVQGVEAETGTIDVEFENGETRHYVIVTFAPEMV